LPIYGTLLKTFTKKKKKSNKIDIKESIGWLDNSIVNEHVRYYEHSDFKNSQLIGNGSFGRVVRANWINANHLFALIFFNNNKVTPNDVVNEVMYTLIILRRL